jgi:hypothetical protein
MEIRLILRVFHGLWEIPVGISYLGTAFPKSLIFVGAFPGMEGERVPVVG